MSGLTNWECMSITLNPNAGCDQAMSWACLSVCIHTSRKAASQAQFLAGFRRAITDAGVGAQSKMISGLLQASQLGGETR